MIIETLVFTDPVRRDPIKRQVTRLLRQIEQAGSMIQALKSGARADGFVLGLEAAGALDHSEIDSLHLFFETALESRLKALVR
jgi:NAD(P)H-nitrite reductase large subunit